MHTRGSVYRPEDSFGCRSSVHACTHVGVYVDQRTTSGVVPWPLPTLFMSGSLTRLKLTKQARLTDLGALEMAWSQPPQSWASMYHHIQL